MSWGYAPGDLIYKRYRPLTLPKETTPMDKFQLHLDELQVRFNDRCARLIAKESNITALSNEVSALRAKVTELTARRDEQNFQIGILMEERNRYREELRSGNPSPADPNIPHTPEKMIEYLKRSGFSLYRAAGHELERLEGRVLDLTARNVALTGAVDDYQKNREMKPAEFKFFCFWDVFNGCTIHSSSVAESIKGGNKVLSLFERT